MKRTITISKKHTMVLGLAFIIALITVFIGEHWGKFKYHVAVDTPTYNYGSSIDVGGTDVTADTPLEHVTFNSPFNATIFLDNQKFQMRDAWYGKLHQYSFKLDCYLQALLKDFNYVIYFWIAYSVLALLFMHFRIKFK